MPRKASLDAVFFALSSPVRRGMIAQLHGGSVPVGELQERHHISLPAISKHLDVLERAGLVTRTPQGRFRYCQLDPTPLGDADAWLRKHMRFWEESLGRLDRLVAASPQPGETDD